MITGLDDVETMRKGFKAGATCFLGKPINKERLYALIKAMRGAMLKEKRRHTRLPFRITVTCRVGPHFDRHFISTSSTISESGMSLELSGGLDAGQELQLEFAMPDFAKVLKVRARMVRSAPPDLIGVEFVNLQESSREAIQRYVEGAIKL
jgi:c-di-GMP-binding flagellar brake protein YcgR